MSRAWALLLVVGLILCALMLYRRAKAAQVVRVVLARRGGGLLGSADDEGAYGADGGDADGGDAEGGARVVSLPLRPHWYSMVLKGEKTIDPRPNRAPYSGLEVGSHVVVRRSRAVEDKTEYEGARRFRATVKAKREYGSLKELLKAEGVSKVFPGVKAIDKVLEEQAEFFRDGAADGPVIAFEIIKT